MEYGLFHTLLLAPATQIPIQNHSHGKNGYFDYLINNSCKEYLFKYFNNIERDRYIEVYVNNEIPEFKVKLHLTTKENKEIKDKIKKSLYKSLT